MKNTDGPIESREKLESDAAGLLSQQLWCFGRDVIYPERNLLLDAGFQRTSPPKNRKNCSSVYSLPLGSTRRILLRGFGVFIGEDSVGGIFIHRFSFRPQFTEFSELAKPPWQCDDLPPLRNVTSVELPAASQLLVDLIHWIIEYEAQIEHKLGKDYRTETILDWDDGKRWCVPFDEMIAMWWKLVSAIEEDHWNPFETLEDSAEAVQKKSS